MSEKPNPLLGPHDGRELELMLSGKKPAAMFYEVIGHDEGLNLIPKEAFQPYIDTGRFIRHEEIFTDTRHSTRYVFYALPEYRKNIARLLEITRYAQDPRRDHSIPWPDELEREVGELLGYSNEAIAFFLKHRALSKKVMQPISSL